ncbi:MAG: ArnT family glycosyltransferase [Hyphomicrobiaceae bacterium]
MPKGANLTSELKASETQSPAVWLAGFIIGLSVLLALRIFALKMNVTDLFYDEAQYWFWSQNLDFGYYSKPAVIAGVIRTATEVCGLSEFCIRLPSPLLHTATAIVICLLARALYDLRVGVIAGLLYATLPAVSLSSSLISTDVPLLFFWALALLALVWLLQSKSWLPALMLGLSLGFGLNAKYAMAFFVLCTAIYLIVTPERRDVLKDPRIWVALGLGFMMLVPNIIWNFDHQFATVSHTADNANWGGPLVHPNKAAEFFLAQFGVFGPILFGVFLVIVWRAWKEGLAEADRFLLTFALPIICIITVQAFLSRAHANWAAVSYVAASVLVTAAFVRLASWRWLSASFALHLGFLALLIVGTTHAGTFTFRWPGDKNPFARTLGWEAFAEATKDRIDRATSDGQPFTAVIADKRSHVAQLIYYLRDVQIPVFAWREGETARDHYQLMRPFRGDGEDRVLFVSTQGAGSPVLKQFGEVKRLGIAQGDAARYRKREVVFYALSGYKKE